MNLIVRVDSDPLGYAAAVQRIIRAVDPDQPIRLIRSMTEVIALTVGDRRQQTTLLVVFGALALGYCIAWPVWAARANGVGTGP